MRIKLPHRVLLLTEDHKYMTGKDKVTFLNAVLMEEVEVNGVEMTLDQYYTDNKTNPSVIVALDMMSYFITKEHRTHQDIMTRETIKKMTRGDGRTVNFTNLKHSDKVNMGMIDDVEPSGY